MRSTSCNCAPARGWMEALLSSPGSVGHEIRPRASSERTTPLPVRSLIANKSFVKGERVAVVPENMILTGAQASSILQHWGPTYAATLSTTTAPTVWMNHFHAVCRALPPATQLVESRDAFLITSALFLMRWVQEDEGRQLPKSGQDPICAWAASLPAKMPPMGAVLEEQLHHQRVCFTPLHKQLRLGSETVAIGDGSVAEAQTELMVSAVEKGVMDVTALTTPTTEVEVSPTMRRGFYNGKRTAMTQRQHEAQVAQRERPQADAARRHYLALEASLHGRCLAPLAAALRGRSSDALKMDDDDDDGGGGGGGGGGADDATWSRLCWAHFMMRSRAVNIHWRSGTSSPAVAVVPFLDQLNHGDASQPANITYRWMAGQQHGTGSVFITASRPIRRGEELVLHYGHRGQRGCLFGASSSPSSSSPTLSERIATELKRVEDRQRLELDHRRTSHAVEEGEMIYNAPTNGADSDVVAAEREAAWLWRFGFARNEAERSFEASARWSAGLRGRIAHLTDARRKGRPGEFVVGVPEGLEHLRRQRERLERERYGSTHVFPPTRV